MRVVGESVVEFIRRMLQPSAEDRAARGVSTATLLRGALLVVTALTTSQNSERSRYRPVALVSLQQHFWDFMLEYLAVADCCLESEVSLRRELVESLEQRAHPLWSDGFLLAERSVNSLEDDFEEDYTPRDFLGHPTSIVSAGVDVAEKRKMLQAALRLKLINPSTADDQDWTPATKRQRRE